MKKLLYLFLLLPALLIVGCSDDDDNNDPVDNNFIKFTKQAGADSMILELSGKDIVVDWGDGTKEILTGDGILRVRHDYDPENDYFVSVSTDKLTEFRIIRDIDPTSVRDIVVGACPVLERLFLRRGTLESFDGRGCPRLKDLALFQKETKSVNVRSNKELEKLEIYCASMINSLDLSQNTLLSNLSIHGEYGGLNQGLASLDISKNVNLTVLIVDSRANLKLTSLDISKNVKLRTCHIAGIDISEFDISKNTALSSFSLGGTKISSLDCSNNPNLDYLHIQSTKLGTEDLNALFHSLPQREAGNRGRIFIPNNPGGPTCDVTIAENKGWLVHDRYVQWSQQIDSGFEQYD